MYILKEQDTEDYKENAQEEYEGVLLYAAALQIANLVGQRVRSPSQEVEESIDNVAVEPSNGLAHAGKDDAVRDELTDFLHI